jgi:NADH:ubiquinone oxidoreductase subunit C
MYNKYLISSVPKFVFYNSYYGIFNDVKKEFNFYNNELYIYLTTDKHYLKKLCSFLFLDFNSQFKVFTDLVAVDYPNKYNRFQLIYNILSINYHQRAFVSISGDELCKFDSIISLYPAANWFEREAWDLYGVHFIGNDDLRRILTDYGFSGHPFRKDFPLSGFTEVDYSLRHGYISYRYISLIQEYRNFQCLSPWDFYQSESNKI